MGNYFSVIIAINKKDMDSYKTAVISVGDGSVVNCTV